MTIILRLILAGALCFSSLAQADNLPDLGEVSQNSFSPSQERKLGDQVMLDIRSDPSYFDDPEVNQYLNNLGYRLASNSPDNRQDFEFFALKDKTVNAFALPGGFIGVHTGTILAAQSESELASVLAHEIAHVTQHHIARMIARDQNTTIASIAALAVAILAARSNSQVADAALASAQAASIQSQINFTREHESEADRIGLRILDKAGFDTRGMETFFERLQKYNRLYDNDAPVYLRDHPLTSNRIADIANRIENTPYRQIPDSPSFLLIRAKLKATLSSPEEALTYFEDSLKQKRYRSEGAQHYGYALALLKAKKYGLADQQIALTRSQMPPNAIIETLAAKIKLAAGETKAALTLYKKAYEDYPLHKALLYDYAEALLRNKETATALNLVNQQLDTHPDDYRLYDLQAHGFALQGKIMAQHRALAEAQARRGNLSSAIEQLQIALKSPDGDFYQMSSAEARLKELKALDAERRKTQ